MFELMNQTFASIVRVFYSTVIYYSFIRFLSMNQRSNQPNEDEVATSEAFLLAQQA